MPAVERSKHRRALILGMVLGIACHLICHCLPEQYRVMCDAVAGVVPHACT